MVIDYTCTYVIQVVCIYIYIYIYCVYIYIYIYIYIYASIYACMYVCMYVYYTYVCVYCIYVCNGVPLSSMAGRDFPLSKVTTRMLSHIWYLLLAETCLLQD